MPIFEFECDLCNGWMQSIVRSASDMPQKHYDVEDKVVDEKGRLCDGALRKLISRPAPAKFKGSGFHVNDYGKRGRK